LVPEPASGPARDENAYERQITNRYEGNGPRMECEELAELGRVCHIGQDHCDCDQSNALEADDSFDEKRGGN
jgi:hypothetical protein